jgi:hypothetical protein
MGASSKQGRGLSPRAKFIAKIQAEISQDDITHLAGFVWDAMQLASSHDPDHAKELIAIRKLSDVRFCDSCSRIGVLEHQMDQIIAGQKPKAYRRIK